MLQQNVLRRAYSRTQARTPQADTFQACRTLARRDWDHDSAVRSAAAQHSSLSARSSSRRQSDSLADDHSFYATCHPGLERIVAVELGSQQIGAQEIEPGKAGVHFRFIVSSFLSTYYCATCILQGNTTVLDSQGLQCGGLQSQLVAALKHKVTIVLCSKPSIARQVQSRLPCF